MRRYLVCIVALLYVAFAVSSCSDRFSVRSVVPTNAFFAAKLNVSDDVYSDLERVETEIDTSSSLGYLLKQALEDPDNVAGLNLTEPVVVSANHFRGNDDAYMYYAAAVSDRMAVTDFVYEVYELYKEDCTEDILSSEPQHIQMDHGVSVYRFGPEYRDDVACAVSDNFVFFCTRIFCNGSQREGATKAVQALLSQKRACSDVGFRRFLKSENTVDIWFNLKRSLSAFSSSIDAEAFFVTYIGSRLPDDLTFNARLDFEKGRTVCGVKTNCRMLKIYLRKYYRKSSGKYMQMLPESAYAVLNCSVDNKLFRMMRDKFIMMNLFLREIVEDVYESGLSDEFIAGLPGTVTMCFAPDGEIAGRLGYVFVAECDRHVYDACLKIFEEGGIIEAAEDGGYSFYYDSSDENQDSNKAYFRYHKQAMVVMSEGLWRQSGYGKSFNSGFRSSELSSAIADGGLLIDVSSIPSVDVVPDLDEDQRRLFTELLLYLSNVVFTYDAQEAEITCNMVDQECTMIHRLVSILCQ